MKEDLQPKRILSMLIILAIAFVFMVQWGPGSKGCDPSVRSAPTSSVAARVNGREIPIAEFQRSYASQLRWLQGQGQTIPESVAEQIGLPGQVLDRLIDNELLAQAAERSGVLPSDAELREIVRSNSDFHKDGKFDRERYREVLQDYYRRTASEYESDLRRRMAANKMQDLVSSTAQTSDEEVKARFIKDGNKANVTYVRFLPTLFAGKVPAASEADLAAYKKDHSKEIQDYYEANRFLYEQPERVRARHILVKVDRNAPEDKKAEAKERIEKLRQQIEAGKDFAAVAKESSEDVGSKESGGDLGLNTREAWVPDFSSVAFSLAPGQMSQPVETQFGYHLIKVEEKKAAEKKELKGVEDEIARQLFSRMRAKELAQAEAEKALAAAQGGKKLADLYPPEKDSKPGQFEIETKPQATETGEFTAGGALPRLGQAEELASAVAATTAPQLLDKVFPAGEGFVVAEVTSRRLPSDEDFNAQKEKLRAEARRAKQLELWDAYLKALKKTGTVESNPQVLKSSSQG